MKAPTDHLAPLKAMIALLNEEQREVLARALHQHVHAPLLASARNVADLRLLARLLEEDVQPPERPPYVERKRYDEGHPAEDPEAPSSERLVERFGSWRRACWAAWSLRPDGRKPMGGVPYPLNRPGRTRSGPYTAEEAIDSIRACTEAIGRMPSSGAYHEWSRQKRHDAREAGRVSRIVPMKSILRLLAPKDAPPRGKWLIARARALDGYQPAC